MFPECLKNKYIYYAAGESIDRIEKLPQTELVSIKAIPCISDDVDEFSIK